MPSLTASGKLTRMETEAKFLCCWGGRAMRLKIVFLTVFPHAKLFQWVLPSAGPHYTLSAPLRCLRVPPCLQAPIFDWAKEGSWGGPTAEPNWDTGGIWGRPRRGMNRIWQMMDRVGAESGMMGEGWQEVEGKNWTQCTVVVQVSCSGLG